MNKKELSELKKHFSAASDRFTLNRVATAFVDVDRNIHNIQIRPYHSIPAEENECLMATLKRVLSGTLGKGLIEYEFPQETYEEGGSQNILYGALQSKLENEDDVSLLMHQIADNLNYLSTYAILIGQCNYTVFQKSADEAENPYDTYEYPFLIAAICPVETRVDGLVYNESEESIERKTDCDRVVAEIPSDGFLYPTFTGNHVLYSARKPKKINVSMVEDVLGCVFTLTAQEQKETFLTLLQEIVKDELSYPVITSINEKLKDIAAEYTNEPDLPVIDDIHMRDILLDSGVSQERAEAMQQAYKEATQDKPIAVNNLIESKTTITLDGVTLQIAGDAESKVRTQNNNGRRYLLIDLDSPEIQINGLTARVAEQRGDDDNAG